MRKRDYAFPPSSGYRYLCLYFDTLTGHGNILDYDADEKQRNELEGRGFTRACYYLCDPRGIRTEADGRLTLSERLKRLRQDVEEIDGVLRLSAERHEGVPDIIVLSRESFGLHLENAAHRQIVAVRNALISGD